LALRPYSRRLSIDSRAGKVTDKNGPRRIQKDVSRSYIPMPDVVIVEILYSPRNVPTPLNALLHQSLPSVRKILANSAMLGTLEHNMLRDCEAFFVSLIVVSLFDTKTLHDVLVTAQTSVDTFFDLDVLLGERIGRWYFDHLHRSVRPIHNCATRAPAQEFSASRTEKPSNGSIFAILVLFDSQSAPVAL
jgi:hypothetical protein